MPFFLCVFLIMPKREFGISLPSMMNFAPKILWRQCSLFTCPNMTSSVSVGLRPAAAKLSARYCISGSEMARPSSVFAARIASTPCESTSNVRPGFGGSWSKRSSRFVYTPSVMRSWSAPNADGGTAGETAKRMPRSTRAMPFSPQFRKMSVALDDHGEIVPFRGVTKNVPPLSSSAPTALRSRAARCSVSSSGPSPSGWMAYTQRASIWAVFSSGAYAPRAARSASSRNGE